MTRQTLRLVWSRAPSVLPFEGRSASQRLVALQSATPIPLRTEKLPATPHYLVLRPGHECYVLDVEHALIRRGASQLLMAFARRRGVAQSLVDVAWDVFSKTYEFSNDERNHLCMYSLIGGRETPHQLELLARL